MARYRGARLKVVRRLGPLPGLTGKTPRAEAQVGVRGAPRRKQSDYARQLLEKQKVRYHYGISESQMRRYVRAAFARGGVTGTDLLASLERRLDSVVFRLGFAPTIPAARQIVRHGHVLVDGKRVDVPGYSVRNGQTISIRPERRGMPIIQESIAARGNRPLPSFLELADGDPFTGRVISDPQREDIPFVVEDNDVIAYYSR